MTAAFDSGREEMRPEPEIYPDGGEPALDVSLPAGAGAEDQDVTIVPPGDGDTGFGELVDMRAAAERILDEPAPKAVPTVETADHEDRDVPMERKSYTPEGRSGATMSADEIPVLPEVEGVRYTSLSVEGRKVALDPEVLGRIVDTTRKAYQLWEQSQDAYCDEFAAEICGGTYNPTRRGDREFFGIVPRFEYDADTMIDTGDREAADRLPTMQPLELGRLEADGILEPVHTIVKLTDVPGLYIGKLGEGSIVVSGLPQIAAYYETTHCVPIVRMQSGSDRFGTILDYTHPSYDQSRPYTVTRDIFEGPVGPVPPEHHAEAEDPAPPELDGRDPWL